MLDVSVLIVNWNTKDFLVQCLGSLLPGPQGMTLEVLVVDNGSTDGSSAAVKERFPEVRLVENGENLGFAKANNQVLKMAKGTYVLLLNPDVQVAGEAVKRLVQFMETHPGAGIAGAQLLNGDGSKQNSIANFPSLATELLNKRFLRWLFPRRYPGKERHYTHPIEVDSVIGAGMMVRRKAIEQVGVLDEGYFLFLEETDWCYRMKEARWKVFHVPFAEFYHHQGKSAEQDKKRAKVEYFRSRYHYFKKHKGTLQWAVLLTGLVLRLTVEVVLTGAATLLTLTAVKTFRKQLSVYAYLLGWHLKGCPEGMGLKPLS